MERQRCRRGREKAENSDEGGQDKDNGAQAIRQEANRANKRGGVVEWSTEPPARFVTFTRMQVARREASLGEPTEPSARMCEGSRRGQVIRQ